MPLPFILLGLGGLAGAVGIGKTVKAGIDAKDAKDTNEAANNKIQRAKIMVEDARKASGKALEQLGSKKVFVLDKSINLFISEYDKIKNIQLSDSTGLNELDKFKLDKQSFKELKEAGEYASSVAGGIAGGAVGGALTAFGAYSAAGAFAAASTGTAISALSGAAATNATLAFFGGGSLAAGGLGIAGGTAVLGGLVAGPALAIMGFVVGAKASAERDRAYANYAEARRFEKEMEVASEACYAIKRRSDMFYRLLIRLDAMFMPLILNMIKAIEEHDGDYRYFSSDQQKAVAASRSIAGAIKRVLDTPILSEEGNLTAESEKVATDIKGFISA